MEKFIGELLDNRKDVVLIFATIRATKRYAKLFRETLSFKQLISRKTAYDFELINGSTVKFVPASHNIDGYPDVRNGYAAILSEVKN